MSEADEAVTAIPAPTGLWGGRPLRLFGMHDYIPRMFMGTKTFLAEQGLEFVDKASAADVIIGKRVKEFNPKILALGRINVVWTKEPFHSFDTVPNITVDGQAIHIFNVYNRTVYTDNFCDILKSRAPAFETLNVDFARRHIVAVMTHKPKTAIVDGVDRSLLDLRSEIALGGHAANGLDIFGSGWPEGVSGGESRKEGQRHTIKMRLLADYNYNLCLENCAWDYYVTEKIWESVIGHCLPIYFAGPTIAQLPFLDAAILINANPTYTAIRDAIENISEREFSERLNTLIAGYNRAVDRELSSASWHRTRSIFMGFLRATFGRGGEMPERISTAAPERSAPDPVWDGGGEPINAVGAAR